MVVSKGGYSLFIFATRKNSNSNILLSDCMHEKLKTKQPRLVNRDGPVLLHDNEWPHTYQAMVHKLQSLNYEILVHLPYSPDISSTDYHISKHFELAISNKAFLNKEEVTETFKQFSSVKDDKFFEDGIYALQEHWMKVINEQGS
ncbi:histone-lysine N-methyltransferase SETMAR-like [Octopus bimaculoides]|uniref:histone-lysine N-methyltransferase SETMAR-like n=1 Tax=Octopus bimaculoides TaxID=37653 RepID=UPI00071DED56|nr:histone-lysine N-methyltransferase SETMAR-like [Octopus bimaculoides]|eukprot:XP_014780083.1 PREDICTED: histone-lysine N-methyltransferase SETMAR-like [Octopus bimaculoides]